MYTQRLHGEDGTELCVGYTEVTLDDQGRETLTRVEWNRPEAAPLRPA